MSHTPEIFTQSIRVSKNDLDEQQHVNNVQYLQWVQDVAKAHWQKRASEDVQKKYFWVVIRHEIDYKKQAFLNDELLVQTFLGDHTHVTSTRMVTILNKKNNEAVIQAKSTWCLMDSVTKKPVKISEELLRVFYQ